MARQWDSQTLGCDACLTYPPLHSGDMSRTVVLFYRKKEMEAWRSYVPSLKSQVHKWGMGSLL